MDANKLKVLQDLPYRIQPICVICKSGRFGMDAFGTCARHQYKHQKHSGGPRQLSIHKYGSCPAFEVKGQLVGFGAFQEFLPDESR